MAVSVNIYAVLDFVFIWTSVLEKGSKTANLISTLKFNVTIHVLHVYDIV